MEKKQNKSHKLVVNKKIAAVVSIIILGPLIVASAFYYWQALPSNYNDNASYQYQQYIPSQGQKIVVICFDDGWQSQWQYAIPILNQYGFKATFGVITGYVNEPAYMTWTEIQKLASNGQDIASHTYNHPYLATLNNSTINYQLSQSKKDLFSHGISSPVFIYPYGSGAGNSTVESFVQQYYSIGRGVTVDTVNLTKSFDRFALPANEIYNTTSFSDFTNIVNQASGSNVVVIFYHRFADDPIVNTMTEPQTFASEMQYLNDNNFTVMTLRQLLVSKIT